MLPPVEKSGAFRVSETRWAGFLISSMAVSQTSVRLNEQILLAMPTAMPWFAFTRIFGKETGSRVGSCMVPS